MIHLVIFSKSFRIILGILHRFAANFLLSQAAGKPLRIYFNDLFFLDFLIREQVPPIETKDTHPSLIRYFVLT